MRSKPNNKHLSEQPPLKNKALNQTKKILSKNDKSISNSKKSDLIIKSDSNLKTKKITEVRNYPLKKAPLLAEFIKPSEPQNKSFKQIEKKSINKYQNQPKLLSPADMINYFPFLTKLKWTAKDIGGFLSKGLVSGYYDTSQKKSMIDVDSVMSLVKYVMKRMEADKINLFDIHSKLSIHHSDMIKQEQKK